MNDTIDTYKGTGVFIITERLYNRESPNWHGIGSAMIQVHKMVYQLCKKQDVYLDGELITSSSSGLWNNIKILFGADLVMKDSSKEQLEFVFEYSGSKFIFTPLDGVNSKYIPRALTKDWKLPTERILSYGKDPVPNVSIFGNANAEYFVSNGGKGYPEAAAKYDGNTKQLVMVHPNRELTSLMNKLRAVK